MLYANRYKASNEQVAQGISRALQLFENSRDYDGSFDEISKTLEIVEPGAVNLHFCPFQDMNISLCFIIIIFICFT